MADLNTPKPELTLRRLEIQVREQELVVMNKELRLLELEEERLRVLADIEASKAHMKRLLAEVSQQKSLKAEQEKADG